MAHAQIQRAKAMTCPGDASGLRWLQQRCRREKRGKADEACRGQVAEDGRVLQPHRAVALGVHSRSNRVTCSDLRKPADTRREKAGTVLPRLGLCLVLLFFCHENMLQAITDPRRMRHKAGMGHKT